MNLMSENQKDGTTNTLAEILNSIDTGVNSNIVNYANGDGEGEGEREGEGEGDGDGEETNKDLSNNTNQHSIQNISSQVEEAQVVKAQVQLLTDTIDRRIGNYLLNELEKKQTYIDELEEAVKFQEKEISDLKSKLDGLNKLELLSKIKSNMETKLVEVETNLHLVEAEAEAEEREIKPKVLSVRKSNNLSGQNVQNGQNGQTKSKIIKSEEQTQYPKSIPDLVFRSDPGTKVKSIPKEQEEPRYNGIMMLDKPKNEPVIKIQLDYGTEASDDNSSTMTNIVKQRRRARGL